MIRCQLFTPCTSDTISKSLHCWCENPKWDFSCSVRNKCQQTRNPGGGSSPVLCQVRDGWPSPPLGPVGCVGSPTPHMWLETLLHSGHVVADWNQVAGAATGHSLHPTPHLHLPCLSPAWWGGGRPCPASGLNWGTSASKAAVSAGGRGGCRKAVNNNSFNINA